MKAVLALNAGSSTLKASVYRFDGEQETKLLSETLRAKEQPGTDLLDAELERVRSTLGQEPNVVGHRIVHGGPRLVAPAEVTPALLKELDGLKPLAPLHLPPALALLRRAQERLPRARHIACFDTAFHRRLPEVAARFALPRELSDQGIHRYGFHGLSYEYVVSTLRPLPERLVVAHLGSGASLAAILRGRSVDTSMGFTPTGGIPMGTRSGDLDPGILIHLVRERGYDVKQLEDLLEHRSGLLGVAGSADMKTLVARSEEGDVAARQAIELFAYAIKQRVGAYAATLGGIDCLVFTGGIGERAPLVRELACAGLGFLGIRLSPERNAESAAQIGTTDSACDVRVLEANEDLVIARHARSMAL